jgi:hypothetical protein
MEKIDIIFWIIGGVVTLNTLILSAIWREVKEVGIKVGRIGERQAEFKVRLTNLENIRFACKPAIK